MITSFNTQCQEKVRLEMDVKARKSEEWRDGYLTGHQVGYKLALRDLRERSVSSSDVDWAREARARGTKIDEEGMKAQEFLPGTGIDGVTSEKSEDPD